MRRPLTACAFLAGFASGAGLPVVVGSGADRRSRPPAAALGRWDDVIELTEGLANEDDLTALLCVYRGVAMCERGYLDASLEAFKEALRSRYRAGDIRKLALSERATTYEAHGKKGMARKDLERVLAMDSHFEGLAELVNRRGLERASEVLIRWANAEAGAII